MPRPQVFSCPTSDERVAPVGIHDLEDFRHRHDHNRPATQLDPGGPGPAAPRAVRAGASPVRLTGRRHTGGIGLRRPGRTAPTGKLSPIPSRRARRARSDRKEVSEAFRRPHPNPSVAREYINVYAGFTRPAAHPRSR
jgi:hypothetical protein